MTVNHLEQLAVKICPERPPKSQVSKKSEIVFSRRAVGEGSFESSRKICVDGEVEFGHMGRTAAEHGPESPCGTSAVPEATDKKSSGDRKKGEMGTIDSDYNSTVVANAQHGRTKKRSQGRRRNDSKASAVDSVEGERKYGIRSREERFRPMVVRARECKGSMSSSRVFRRARRTGVTPYATGVFAGPMKGGVLIITLEVDEFQIKWKRISMKPPLSLVGPVTPLSFRGTYRTIAGPSQASGKDVPEQQGLVTDR